jgi:flagellar basal-body rod protein FlgB
MGFIKQVLFAGRTSQVLKQAISLNAEAAAISGANISNAETPGYKAQKFEFESALRDATSGPTLPMRATNLGHFTGSLSDISSIKGVTDVDLSPGRIDGNNVNLDKEVVNFSQAQITYDAVITAMTAKGAGMKSAITDAK